MRFIPIDIVTNILSRLPVKPLLRFKSVSKGWYDLISDQDFTKRHLENTNNSDGANLRMLYNIVGEGFEHCDAGVRLYTVDLSPILCETQKQLDLKPDEYLLLKRGFHTKFIGSYNGIFCFRNIDGWGFTLLNPATRNHLDLRDIEEDKLSKYDFSRRPRSSTSWYGFGYEEGTDDYKVVKITQSTDNTSNLTKIMVYSWRNKKWNLHYLDWSYTLFKHIFDSGTSSNNALHWVAQQKYGPSAKFRYVIVSFDLSTEKFRPTVIPLPIDHENVIAGFELVGINGFLHLMVAEYVRKQDLEKEAVRDALNEYEHQQGHPGLYRVDVWVMKNYWVADSWCKLCSNLIFGYGSTIPRILSVLKRRNDILLHARLREDKIYLANLATDKLRDWEQFPIRWDWDQLYIFPEVQPMSESYIESLVTLDVDEHLKMKMKRGIKRRASDAGEEDYDDSYIGQLRPALQCRQSCSCCKERESLQAEVKRLQKIVRKKEQEDREARIRASLVVERRPVLKRQPLLKHRGNW